MNPQSNFSDNCNYRNDNITIIRCGDICSEWTVPCICEDQVVHDFQQFYCCTPPDVQCSETGEEESKQVWCPQGEVLSIKDAPMCHGRCYNDYLTSQYIGEDAHYTCPEQCIPVADVACQGVSFCDADEEICGEDLRCGSDDRHIISTLPARYYCGSTIDSDSAYDRIDRSDEDILQIHDTVSWHNINYTALTNCSFIDPDPAFWCDGVCRPSTWWCSEKPRPRYCEDQIFGQNHMIRYLNRITCLKWSSVHVRGT